EQSPRVEEEPIRRQNDSLQRRERQRVGESLQVIVGSDEEPVEVAAALNRDRDPPEEERRREEWNLLDQGGSRGHSAASRPEIKPNDHEREHDRHSLRETREQEEKERDHDPGSFRHGEVTPVGHRAREEQRNV